MVGYSKDLFILPFDHRSSFIKGMFGIEGREPTNEEKEKVKHAKKIIYEGFKKAVKEAIPQGSAGILVDEEYGEEILIDAKDNGYISILTTEKTGKDEIEINYEDLSIPVKKYKPTFLKALLRYNPGADSELNARQAKTLAFLTQEAYHNSTRLLIEPLIPATDDQLAKVEQDKNRYDQEIRPELTVQMIKELQDAGVNPDVWKIEGFENPRSYTAVVEQARFSGRDSVGIVVLGRAADDTTVGSWVKAGAEVNGVIGFAIGRTIFWDALSEFFKGNIDEAESIKRISDKYIHYYKLFIETRSK